MALRHKWISALLAASVVLAGCGGDEPEQAANSASDGESAAAGSQDTHTASEKGSEEADTATITAPIKEAENVPAEEKTAILAALDQQINAFNSQDLEGYMSTISKTPESFNYEEEKAYIEKVFQTFEASMKPVHATIIKYDEKTKTASVFMNMESTSKDRSSEKKVSQTTRQIMVFQKEAGGWKQVSLFAME